MRIFVPDGYRVKRLGLILVGGDFEIQNAVMPEVFLQARRSGEQHGRKRSVIGQKLYDRIVGWEAVRLPHVNEVLIKHVLTAVKQCACPRKLGYDGPFALGRFAKNRLLIVPHGLALQCLFANGRWIVRLQKSRIEALSGGHSSTSSTPKSFRSSVSSLKMIVFMSSKVVLASNSRSVWRKIPLAKAADPSSVIRESSTMASISLTWMKLSP